MSWNYSASSTENKDRVRRAVGDTDKDDQLISDEEIEAVLVDQPVVNYAAAAVADLISAKFARRADKTIGKTSISASQVAKAYERIADRLRAGGAGTVPGGDGSGVPTAVMFVGGTTKSGNRLLADNPDTEQQSFARGQDDNPSEVDRRRGE